MRDRNAEHPGGLSVDSELKLARLRYRHVHGLRAFEDPADINALLMVSICDVASVAHQPTRLGVFTSCIDRGDSETRCQQSELDTPNVKEGVAVDKEGVGSFARKRRESGIDLAASAGFQDPDLQSHGAGSDSHLSK